MRPVHGSQAAGAHPPSSGNKPDLDVDLGIIVPNMIDRFVYTCQKAHRQLEFSR